MSIVPATSTSMSSISDIAAQAHKYAEQSRADNTKRAYQSDWRKFEQWCIGYSVQALPASVETVALYLTEQAQTCKTSTLQRYLVSISQAHKLNSYAPPTQDERVRTILKGIKRTKGTAQQAKAPVVTSTLRTLIDALPDTLVGLRDRALLLVGFAAALRRSELVSLDVEDVQFAREGLVITLRKSKNDQEQQGRKIGVPYGSHPVTCPVRALQEWLEQSQITSGALFRAVNKHQQVQSKRLTDQSVALVVKRAAQGAELDASQFSGHSLRAGLATAAAQAGVSERAIMQQTGHHSVMLVRRYIREGSLFNENAAASVGL